MDDIKKELQDAWGVATLQDKTIQAVAKDKNKTKFAFGIIIVSALLVLVGGQIFPFFFKPTLSYGISTAIFQIIGSIISIYVISFIAKVLFKGSAEHNEFFRVMGYGMIVAWIGLIPQLSVIGSIWTFVIFCVILKRLHKLTTGKIIGTILIGLFIIGAIMAPLSFGILMKNAGNINQFNNNLKMNTNYGNMDVKDGKVKIKTKDGEIEYTIPNIK